MTTWKTQLALELVTEPRWGGAAPARADDGNGFDALLVVTGSTASATL